MHTTSRGAGLALLAATILCIATVAAADVEPKIAQVFFAQTHVQAPDDPLFKLVGNREALIKVQVYSETGQRAPLVIAQLALNGKTLELPLRGPAVLPKPPTEDLHLMKHSYDDSFTAMIPKEWIKTGLKVAVEMKNPDRSKGSSTGNRVVFDPLLVGAPSHLTMWMFDVHFFRDQKQDYPHGWFEELYQKLPVSALELRRIPTIVFEKLVMQPRGGKPATLCSSREEYKEKTGMGFDGEQDVAKRWNGALKHAARAEGQLELYYLNIYGVPAGGEGGLGVLSGVGNGHQPGILLHELGHVFGLPHWGTAKRYPYRGNMYGMLTDSSDTVHVGPTWAFDLSKGVFIPPTVQASGGKGTVGLFKRDPMWGGGTGDQEKPFLFRHFSDYSVQQIQTCLESKLVWNEVAGNYATWNQANGTYSNLPKKTTDKFPIERDADVISILASASGVTAEANIIYPPIGPYKTGLSELFDASSPAENASARQLGYNESNCNLCFKVTQGGKTKTYLVPVKVDKTEDPLNANSFKTFAINVPARNGDVTQVDLLHAPDVMKTGAITDSKVLFSWKKSGNFAGLPQAPTSILGAKETTVSKKTTPTPTAQPKMAEPARAEATPKPTSAPKASVPDDVRLEWLGKLSQEIAANAKAGKPLKGWVSVGGKAALYPLMGADDKQVQVAFNGTAMPMNWSWFKPNDLVALAKSVAKDDNADSQLILGVFLLANGDSDAGETAFARAALLDAPSVEKLRERLKASQNR
ncbi:MAG: M66 family metalloprotease [Planctomycetota bacterium]